MEYRTTSEGYYPLIWKVNEEIFEEGDLVAITGLEFLSCKFKDESILKEQVFELVFIETLVLGRDEYNDTHAILNDNDLEIRHATKAERLLFYLQREDYKKKK